jgi:UV DNA damage repair endonuclease
LSTYAEFLTQIEAVDGVIICHMLSPSPDAWHMLRELPALIRTYLAVELTNQPVDSICNYGIPIIFDWLHYHIQGTWPYNPLMAAVTCHHTWGTRRPLLHLSSPDTSDYGEHHKHIHGRHSAYLDWATLMHFVGQLNAHIGDAFDIEIEAKAGAKAVAHFLRQCQLHTPPHWQHIWQSRL